MVVGDGGRPGRGGVERLGHVIAHDDERFRAREAVQTVTCVGQAGAEKNVS